MTDLATIVVRLEAEIGKYSENLDKANKQLKHFTDEADSLFGDLAGAVAAYFTVDRLKAWGEHILENADHLAKFSQSTGVAVEDLSRLNYALEASGVEGEQADKLFTELNKSIAEAAGSAKSDAARAFRALGVDIRDTSGHIKDAKTLLFESATGFASYADGANKSAIAQTLLGKAGAAAIPFLNEGADGIKRLADESDRLGNTVSTKTAKAAEEFNDRLGRLRHTLIDGIGNRIAEQLLPALNQMGEELESTAEGADLLDAAASAAATGLRLLLTAGLAVGTIFEKVGDTLGAAGAAAVAFATGNFKQARDIIVDNEQRMAQQDEAFQKRLATIWREGGDNVLREVKVHADRMKAEAPNIAAAKEIEKAADDAIKKLVEMQRNLAEQVATFGLGDAEATKYRLTIGNLADEVAAAGQKGHVLADSIIEQANALQKLKDTKEITKALGEVSAQIEAIKGNSADAAIAAFDAKNAELVTKLRREGNVEGQKQLDTLLTLTVAQADFNEQVEKAQRIQSDLALEEERLRNSREAGALTELGFQSKLGEARLKAASDLEAVAAAQDKIARQVGNEKLIDDVKKLGGAIETLKTQADVLANSIRAGFEDSFGDALEKFVLGTESAGAAFREFVADVGKQLAHLATQQIAQQVFGSLGSSEGGGGGLFATLAGLFAGGRATGGDVNEGMAYRVNERTPNSEWFVPKQAGQVVPADRMGGRSIVNRISVSIAAPSGTVERRTQLSTAATVARAVTLASRRNN